MCPTKALGPNGLQTIFFQKHLGVVKKGVIPTCLHVLNQQCTIALFNHTYIVLIPKNNKPRKITDYRLINLCNIINGPVAKAIANRMKQILHQIISPMQSAFVLNRLMTDNIIIGYECLHKIRHNKGKKSGLMALKLDISKTYDRVEWSFLKHAMERLGFSCKWINLIIDCLNTSSFSIIINGAAKGLIYPRRSLRQGCSLSPYLFLLCAEVFSNFLVQVERQSLIHGLRFD